MTLGIKALILAYRTVRENITELAADPPDAADLVIPACPEWTVRDLVEHLAGNCASMTDELLRGNGVGLGELLEGWRVSAERVERLTEQGQLNIARLLMDAFTHELDLRAALDVAPPVDHPAYPPAFEVVVGGLAWSIHRRGLPTLRLTSDDASWVTGAGEPAATVAAPRYDLYRSLTGRRTPAQIASLGWSEDPGRWVPAFFWGPFSPPVDTVA